MSLAKPTFASLIHHYPPPSANFGVTHTCAIRMSIALMNAVPDFFAGYAGPRQPRTGAITNALLLAHYLEGSHVGWPARRLGSPPSRITAHRAAHDLRTQGIIFWEMLPEAEQIAFRARSGSRLNRASPNHIDLWDPACRALRNRGGRTMMWIPEAGIVQSVWFWEIPVRQGTECWLPMTSPFDVDQFIWEYEHLD
jgi:hypothetical protein